MADFPYTPNPPNIGKFLDHIQNSGTPTKVSISHLKSVGFKSSNDGYIVGVLKSLGFVDSSGVPTPVWQAYRDKGKAAHVLAQALQKTYADLFAIYPDAYRKDDEALRNYFAGNTNLATVTIDRVVRTFKVLAEKANFEGAEGTDTLELTSPAPAKAKPIDLGKSAVPTVNINIQLQLPATDDAETYDKLFAAMKKHLFP